MILNQEPVNVPPVSLHNTPKITLDETRSNSLPNMEVGYETEVMTERLKSSSATIVSQRKK